MESKSRSKKTAVYLLWLSLIFSALAAYGCAKKTAPQENDQTAEIGGNPEEESAYRVNAKRIGLSTIYRRINIDGDVATMKSADIVPNISGTLHSYLVEEGQPVRKGQVIAQVDPSKPGQQFLLSPVTAPIAGILNTVIVKVGNPVSPTSIIAKISDDSELVVELFIPEKYVSEVNETTIGYLSLISFPDRRFKLKTRSISPTLSSITHTMRLTMEFLETDIRMKPGMFGTTELILKEFKDIPIIRRDHIVQRFFNERNNIGVFRVEDERAVFQIIELGEEDGDYYEVKNGLSEGDLIVTSGQESLVNGTLLQVLDLEE